MTRVATVQGVLYSTSYKKLIKKNSSVVEYKESSNKKYVLMSQSARFRRKETVSKVFVDSQFYEQQRGILMIEPNALTNVHVNYSKCIYMDIKNNNYIGKII